MLSAADPSYSIPSQNAFTHSFGAHAPGDVLGLNVVPDPGVKNLTGKVDNASSAGWVGGPAFTCTIPDNFSGAHLGKFSGTYTKEKGGKGGKGEPPDPPAWAGAASSDIVSLKHQTVATTPADRARLTVGVGEEVDIRTVPPTAVTWTINGGGTVTPANGVSTRFTAPNVKADTTVTATLASGGVMRVEFSVIQPEGVEMKEGAPFVHWKGFPSAGFLAKPIVILPTTVSFYRIEAWEGTVKAKAKGVFSSLDGFEHAPTEPAPCDEANVLAGEDYVKTVGTTPPVNGNYEGTFIWSIPWFYRIRGSEDEGKEFRDKVDHIAVSDEVGTTTVTKAGAVKTFKLDDEDKP